MQHTLAAAAPYMSAAASYDERQAHMERGLSEDERKWQHFKAYKLRNTRGRDVLPIRLYSSGSI